MIMYQITGRLYYGGLEVASEHDQYLENGIDHVIQLTYEPPEDGYPKDVTTHTYSMMDGPRNDENVFREAARNTAELLESNSRIFVHCSAGQSRSVCVAAAALGRFEQIPFETALKRVREAGPTGPHEALIARGRQF